MGESPEEQPENQFHTELRQLLNKHSKENGSNTPDFVLSSFLLEMLSNFDYHVNYRESTKIVPPALPTLDVDRVQAALENFLEHADYDTHKLLKYGEDIVDVDQYPEYAAKFVAKYNES